MVDSLQCICLWSKDVGPLFSFVGPVDNSRFLSRTKYMPLCPQHILEYTRASKCGAFRQKEIIFRGSLFSSLDLIQLNRLKDYLAFVSKREETWLFSLVCLVQLLSGLQIVKI